MDYLPIDVESIPYRFDIELSNEIYTFEIHYNERGDFFTVDLLKNEDVLAYGEKIVFNQPLFANLKDDRFPIEEIVPRTEGGQYEEITYDNFYTTVFLAIEGGADE